MLDEDIEDWPTLTLAIFIERPTPFLREFLEKVSSLTYPKNKITVLLHNNVSKNDVNVHE